MTAVWGTRPADSSAPGEEKESAASLPATSLLEPSSTDPHPRLTRCAWIPLACLAAAALVLVPLNPDWGFNPPLLFAGLNLLFASAVPFVVALLAGRAFLAGGSWTALLLGAGMLAFGLGSGLAASLNSFYGFSVNVVIHNVGMFLAGVCHLTGVLLTTARHAEARRARVPGMVLASSYLTIGLVMGVVTLGAIDGLVPPFFTPESGTTLLRNVVLGAAVAQFAISALLLRIGFVESGKAFHLWYAYGLGLVTLGLSVAFFVLRSGSPVSWLARTAQYLGAAYILVAVRTVLWDYYTHGLSVGRALAAFFGETQTQYRSLVESSTDALVSLDADGTILFWNAAAYHLFGSTLVEVSGRNLADCIVGPEAAGDLRRDLYSLPRTPDGLVGGTRIERELLARSGRAFPAEIAFLGRTTPGGRVTIAVIRDITERRQAEAALRQANEALEARVQERTTELEAAAREAQRRADELDAVFAAMTEAVMVYDAQGRPIKANREARAAFGFDPIGSDRETRARALNLRYPDGSPVPLEDLPSRRAERGERVRDERFIQIDARGKDCIVRSSASPLFFNDRFIGTVSVWQDITEQERAAEQLRELSQRLTYHVEHSPLAVIEWGPDMRLTRWSQAAERIFGWTAAEVLGKRMEDFRWIYQEDQMQVGEVSAELQTGTNPRRFSANRNYRKDGSVIHCEWFNSSLLDEAGKLRSILSLVLDVTERKQAEVALQQAHAELEHRVQDRTAELSRTLRQVSFQSEQLRSLASELTLVEQRERVRLAEQIHDGLQQLLVAAKLRVILLGRGDAPPVRQSCQEIGALLEEALADARSLTAELSPPVLRTGGILAGLEWLARWSAEKHHLTVHVQAPPAPLRPLPEDLTALLFHAVRELLLNAVKYAQVQEADVILAWDAPGLTLTVADAGAGFDPSALRGEGGGGFGLARIRHRLELLGGCMNIASAPGQGTRVTLAVLVPTADQPSATPALPQPIASPQTALAAAPGSPRKIRILIVDDHQIVRQALAQLLRVEEDIEVVGEAGTGTAAVAQARQLKPDVVLMDINMPEMNGIEATRAIHAAFPTMRVIGLSMFDRDDQQAEMQDAGAVAYLSKAGPAEALLAAIRRGR